MLNPITHTPKVVHHSLSVTLIFDSSLRIVRDADLGHGVGWQFRACYINATLGRNAGPSVRNSGGGCKHPASQA
jgi:hypothetical protein